jgi:malonyl CoA-acyl carrier protein transacylase
MRDLVAQRAPELLEKVTELVGEDPFARVEENTRFAQPAIFCASVVGWDALDLHPSAGAGHSLGELAALVAAGVLKRDDALELVVLRGKLMGEARNGSMLALVGATLEDAQAIAAAGGVTVANDNAPGQVVLSGPADALDAATEAADDAGLKAMRLPVKGGFHSPTMEPAVPRLRAALDRVSVKRPRFPVFSSITAKPFDDVRAELALALTHGVRWRETLLALRDTGVRRFAETGPGKVVTGLVRRTLDDVEAFAAKPEADHA